jgi:hypothetical protein
MAAPKGNSFWKSRSKHGRDALFTSPDALLQAAEDYFQWCDENPWEAKKTVVGKDNTTVETKPTQRPYSLGGFRHYVGASENWLSEFKKNCSKDFLGVIEQIENFIRTQQFEGATVGAFNANIIARTLGLMEKTDITTGGEKIQQPTLNKTQIDKLIDKL